MTTEPPEQSSPLAGVSVRTRLTAAVAFLTGLALAVAGVLVYTLESAHLDSAVRGQIEQEIAEFEQLQQGKDPETAEAFRSVESLIDLFLRRNVPDDSEVLVGYWNGAARVASPGSPHPELLRSRVFLDAVDRLIDSGGSEQIETDHGEVIVTVSPVRSSTTTGGLVVVSFMAEERAELVRVMQTYAIVSLLLLGLITAAAAWQAGRLLSPLRTLRDTAQEITETDLSRRIPEQGNDDITALTRTFNEMLSRLASAFTAQRQFLDDAGHELKTPLTVLRGHLELVDTTNPRDVEVTRALVLDEVDRMSRLVEDLILLAKANRPDFIRTKKVHLATFLDTVLEKCRALGQRTWLVDGAADTVVELDEQRITQALLELAQNAVKHTDDGDEVALGCRMSNPHGLELWVRDAGHGIAEADRNRIFERFGRGAVAADDEGFGLGLSIVAAIVHAHGGTVQAAEAPARGARFTITIPVGTQEDQWQGS